MVSDLTVMSEGPGGRDIFFGLVEMAFPKLYPAERVPVSDQRWNQRQIFLRKAIEREIAQRRSRRRYGGLGILLGAIQMRLFQRELVGNVVPDKRCGVQFDGMIEGGEGLVVLAEIQVGIAEADLQFGAVGRERSRFLQFGRGQIVLVPLGIHGSEVGVGKFVQGIIFQLLAEGLHGVVILALLPIDAAEIVVGKLIVGIDFDLLLK